jgi:hypothetical protein
VTRSPSAKRRTKRLTKLYVQEQVADTLRNDYGTPTAGWQTSKNPDGSPIWLMGYVDYRSGTEIQIARMTVPTVNVRISIPYYPRLTTQKHRLVSAKTGETYQIAAINNVDDQDREMIVLATAIPSTGSTPAYNPTVKTISYD